MTSDPAGGSSTPAPAGQVPNGQHPAPGRVPRRVQAANALLRWTWRWSRIRDRRDPRRWLRRAAERLQVRSASDGQVVWTAYDVSLRDRPGDETFLMCRLGAYGYRLADLLRDERPGYTFLDVGANVGLYSAVAAARGAAEVHAFEPDPTTAAILRWNLDRATGAATGTTTRVHEVAVSNRAGAATLRRVTGHSGRSAVSDPVDAGGAGGGGSVGVELVDERYLSERITVDPSARVVVKIDVEGHELEVLEALCAWPGVERVAWIWVECRAGEVAGRVDDLLRGRGFREVERVGDDAQWDARYERVRTVTNGRGAT